MKLLSWNVNGLRSCLKKGFLDLFDAQKPDLLALQETKVLPEQVSLDLPGYTRHWNSADKPGYSGTAVFTRVAPLSVTRGIGMAEHDREGRVITLEFADFHFVNVYTPNSRRGLTRLDYRRQWNAGFLAYVKKLEKKKPVVFCGDLNVAHTAIDLANPKSNVKNAGFTPEEREDFDAIVHAGFLDSFREFEKEGGHYTWWTYRNNARERNIGWRIDYFCISSRLRPRLEDAFILPEVPGSDHCPVGIVLTDNKGKS